MGLAEPKRKIVFNPDPNNYFWRNNKDGFGYRMLKGMGWSEGKGLGREESGRSQHLIINRRQDLSGIGCNSKDTDELQNRHDLDALLKSIANKFENSCESKISTPSKNPKPRRKPRLILKNPTNKTYPSAVLHRKKITRCIRLD